MTLEKQLANTVITTYAILNGIIAFVLFMLALAVTFLTPFATTMILSTQSLALPPNVTTMALQQLATGIGIIVGIIIFMLAALFLSLARGLWKRQRWARIVQLAACVPQLLSFPIGTLIGGFGIYAFAFDKEIREQFGVPSATINNEELTPSKLAKQKILKKNK